MNFKFNAMQFLDIWKCIKRYQNATLSITPRKSKTFCCCNRHYFSSHDQHVIVDARSHTCKSHDFTPRYDIIVNNAFPSSQIAACENQHMSFDFVSRTPSSLSQIMEIPFEMFASWNDAFRAWGHARMACITLSLFASLSSDNISGTNVFLLDYWCFPHRSRPIY